MYIVWLSKNDNNSWCKRIFLKSFILLVIGVVHNFSFVHAFYLYVCVFYLYVFAFYCKCTHFKCVYVNCEAFLFYHLSNFYMYIYVMSLKFIFHFKYQEQYWFKSVEAIFFSFDYFFRMKSWNCCITAWKIIQEYAKL